jgi:hypothetical protein
MVIVRRAQPDYFRLLTALVEIAKLPPEDWAARVRLLESQANLLPMEFKSWYQSTAAMVGLYQIDQALLRCTVAALAVERYRLAHGQWPESLDSVVPEYLPAAPTDPFDGQPLRFRRLENGLVIYSVGLDLHDDGGILNRQNPGAQGTDLGIQLWDMSQRRQPWRPPSEPVPDDDAEEASRPAGP